MAQLRRWHIYPSLGDFEGHAAAAIRRAAAQAIAAHGRFTVVLAGGHTPRGVYARLAEADADWAKWHVYFGDERCLPAGHPERNDQMAREAWLDRVALPPQIHAIPAELGPGEAARRYAETLARVGTFDLVLLGLGEDGHTASLFPGREIGGDVLAVKDASKPPRERVSLGAARLGRAQQVLFLVAGAEKRDAVEAWRRGEAIPASAIAPAAGVDILLDAAAWGESHV